jgi:hypothetical protein
LGRLEAEERRLAERWSKAEKIPQSTTGVPKERRVHTEAQDLARQVRDHAEAASRREREDSACDCDRKADDTMH